jgi:long-subunit fatty acid transport protein
VAWEDWSTADTVSLAVNASGTVVPLGFQDTWRIGFGAHYALTPDWKLTTGYSYDSSSFKNKDRIAAIPVDEQHRLAFGAIHQLSESTRLGLVFEWVHLGEAKIRQNTIRGSYGPNEIFFLGATVNWMTPSWRQTFGMSES